ncbi:MAG: TlpA family protein disulfide reductase [Bacteroidota bacterium]|nr:TlpA family protein disulfide reductase [Bacteroidota bacterium]
MPIVKPIFIAALLIGGIFLSNESFCQSIYKLTIRPPEGAPSLRIRITIDNGKIVQTRTYLMKDHPLLITGPSFGFKTWVSIEKLPGIGFSPVKKEFLIGGSPASFVISGGKSQKGEIQFENQVEDVSSLQGQFDSLTRVEAREIHRLRLRHPGANDPDFQEQFETIRKKHLKQEFRFLAQNQDSYYSFLILQRKLATDPYAEPERLYRCYSGFPGEWQNTSAGKSLGEYLYGLVVFRSENIKAPHFRSHDISGKPIRYMGNSSHYTLVNLWATWCIPCVKELPALKLIARTDSQKLQIISISLDQNKDKMMAFVKKHGMEWPQIFGDSALITKFGGGLGIPLLYLIDKKGMIVYNRLTEGDNNQLDKLKDLIEKLP